MSVLDIVGRKDPILTTKIDPYVFENPEQAMSTAQDLLETLRHWKYPGIAANEVGINARIICLESDPAYVMFNPVITATYGEGIVLEETDISRRGLICKLKRPEGIRIRFQDYNGDKNAMRFTGMTARTIQHLIDTLDGNIFYNKANSFHRQQALKKFKKISGIIK